METLLIEVQQLTVQESKMEIVEIVIPANLTKPKHYHPHTPHVHFLNQWEDPADEDGTQHLSTLNHSSVVPIQDDVDEDDVKGTMTYNAAVLVWTLFAPMLLFLGTASNLAAIVVLKKVKTGASSTLRLHLSALAVSDLCLLWVGLLRQWVKYAFDVDVRNYSPGWCKLHIWIVYTTGVVSAWMLVVVTAQRVLSVTWPHRVGLLCSTRNAFALVLVVVFFSSALHVHFLYGMDLKEDAEVETAEQLKAPSTGTDGHFEHEHTRSTRTRRDVDGEDQDEEEHKALFGQFPHLHRHYHPHDYGETYTCSPVEDYIRFHYHVWPTVDLLMSSLLPSLLLLGCNLWLIIRIRGSVEKVKLLKEGSDMSLRSQASGPCRKKVATSLTWTLTVLTLTFIALTLPLHADILWYEESQDRLDAVTKSRGELSFALTSLMWYSNSAINFFLYCLSGTKFRREFHRWARCGGRFQTVLGDKIRVRFMQRRASSATSVSDDSSSGILCRLGERLRGVRAGLVEGRVGEQQQQQPHLMVKAGLLSPMYCAASPTPNSMISMVKFDLESSDDSL